jgi:hypothetical protein
VAVSAVEATSISPSVCWRCRSSPSHSWTLAGALTVIRYAKIHGGKHRPFMASCHANRVVSQFEM